MFALLVKHNLMRDDFRSDPELMASSVKELRPIHCEMVRQKLITDFFEPSSLPCNIKDLPSDLKHQQNSSVKTSSSIQDLLEKFEDFKINGREKKKKEEEEEEEKREELLEETGKADDELERRDSGIGSSLDDEDRRYEDRKYSITETVFDGRLNITRAYSTHSLNRPKGPKKKKRMERRGSAYDYMLFDIDLES